MGSAAGRIRYDRGTNVRNLRWDWLADEGTRTGVNPLPDRLSERAGTAPMPLVYRALYGVYSGRQSRSIMFVSIAHDPRLAVHFKDENQVSTSFRA
jgi:hypothetical protein